MTRAHRWAAASIFSTRVEQGSTDPGRGRVLLQYAGLAEHDRQRIVELMGDAGEQRAKGGKFLVLVKGVALALDFLGGRPRRRQVAHVGREEPFPGQHDLGDRQLDRDDATVLAACLQRHPAPQHARLARQPVARHARLVRLPVGCRAR